jgi:hypothetical protein
VCLSTELLEAAQAQLDATPQAGSPATEAVPVGLVPPALNRWTGAIQCAGLAGAIAAALTLVSFAAQPVMLLTVFWGISAPIVVLGVYAARFRNTRITAGFAARLGILCGVAILLGTFTLSTLQMCVERFLLHAGGEIDKQIANSFAQSATIMKSWQGEFAAQGIAKLQIPEVRAGIILVSSAFSAACYLFYSAVAGAFAGLLRSRSAVKPSAR